MFTLKSLHKMFTLKSLYKMHIAQHEYENMNMWSCLNKETAVLSISVISNWQWISWASNRKGSCSAAATRHSLQVVSRTELETFCVCLSTKPWLPPVYACKYSKRKNLYVEDNLSYTTIPNHSLAIYKNDLSGLDKKTYNMAGAAVMMETQAKSYFSFSILTVETCISESSAVRIRSHSISSHRIKNSSISFSLTVLTNNELYLVCIALNQNNM